MRYYDVGCTGTLTGWEGETLYVGTHTSNPSCHRDGSQSRRLGGEDGRAGRAGQGGLDEGEVSIAS